MGDESNNTNNIILFPGLSKRLLDKGKALLESKQYKDALTIFEQLQEVNSTTQEAEIGIVVCLLELGRFQEARKKCKRLLETDVGDYYDILQIYLTILVQLNEYQELIDIVEAVLQENKVPAKIGEHLFQLLEFGRKMKEGAFEETIDIIESPRPPDPYPIDFSGIHNMRFEEQVLLMDQLKNAEIEKYMKQIEALLVDDSAHPMIKTMLVQLLIERQLDHTFFISKFGKEKRFIPVDLPEVFEDKIVIQVENALEDNLGQENPALFDVVRQLWHQQLYILYPFLPEPYDPSLWAAALHKTGYTYHGISVSTEEVCVLYEVSLDKLEYVYKKVLEIEQYTQQR